MLKDQIIANFKKSFRFDKDKAPRGIGVECEIPVVTQAGEAIALETTQQMFAYLQESGFELIKDEYSDLIIEAKRVNNSNSQFGYSTDIITTDTGYSIIEVVLAPQDNLHTIQSKLQELLSLLLSFFKSQHCLMLGYGIQPLTFPSRNLMMPKERYGFFERFSSNHFIKSEEGADSSFLNITASNQCHIEIGLSHAIKASNTLNALSGLQVALHANSPIWNGEINPKYKASREIVWDFCFPDRAVQIGIPPAFDSIEKYVEYLLKFKPLLVKRDGHFLQILNKDTFHDFLLNDSPAIGSTLNGNEVEITPVASDFQELIPFSWFNARLVPKYGTVESRMCCQQPQGGLLTSAAITLGLVENLQKAQQLANRFSLEEWREIRKGAAQNAINASIGGDSIVPLLTELLDIAKEGLKMRGFGEGVFLRPLYDRVKQRKAPADFAVEVFQKHGFEEFLRYVSFK